MGGSGADTYMGGAGNDMIYADREDTTIDGGSEADGMPGMDTLSFARFMDGDLEDGTGITLNLQTSTTVSNIEHLIGTAETDMLTGRNGLLLRPPRPLREVTAAIRWSVAMVLATPFPMRVPTMMCGLTWAMGLLLMATAGSTARGGHAGGDTISGFENVIGSAYGDDLTARWVMERPGHPGSTLWGLDGDDELEGGAGNDTLEGGAGADELNGGTVTRGTPAESTVPNSAANDADEHLVLCRFGRRRPGEPGGCQRLGRPCRRGRD